MSRFRELKNRKKKKKKKKNKKRPPVLKPDNTRQDKMIYYINSAQSIRLVYGRSWVQFLSGTQNFFFCVLLSTHIISFIIQLYLHDIKVKFA